MHEAFRIEIQGPLSDGRAGKARFTRPTIGERALDFNTEGFVHIGLLPELLEDARLGGATKADLEPLFRSAEGYIRLWERAEARFRTLPQPDIPFRRSE